MSMWWVRPCGLLLHFSQRTAPAGLVLVLLALNSAAAEPAANSPETADVSKPIAAPSADTVEVTPAAAEPAPDASVAAAPGPDASAGNPAASIFLQKCAGCHTVGKGNLSGPDLKPTVAWPRPDLEAAITRMEKSVGPMDPAEIRALADLLLSPDAASQLEAAQRQVALAHAATLEPGSETIGEALFHGNRPFANRAVSCAACHEAGGRGGDLAVALDGSFTRLGETALLSAIENPGFPLMKAVYARHPVTKQEAMHIAAYLKLNDTPGRTPRKPPVQAAGMGLAAVALVGIGYVYRNRLKGVRASLVQRAKRRTRGA